MLTSSDVPFIRRTMSRGPSPSHVQEPGAIGGQGRRLEVAVLGVLLLLAELALKGYQFGVSDQNDELPLIRRALDPTYLSQDWFVNAASGPFDARRGYAWLMAWLVRALGEPAAFWLVFSATIVVLGVGVMILARSRGWRVEAAFAAAFIVIANDQGSLGLSTLVLPLLVPSTIAWALLVWAWAALERGRWIFFGLACGAAALIHPLIGSGGFGLLFVWSWLRTTRPSLASSALAAVAFSVLAFPSVWPILEAHFTAGSTVDVEAVRIMTMLRGPWHYLPATWPVDEWIGFGGFLALATIVVRRGRDDNLGRFALLVLAMDVLAIAAVEVHPIPLIEELQLFRLTIFVQVIGGLLVGRLVGELLERRRPIQAVALTTLVLGATLLDPRLLLVACLLAGVIRLGQWRPRVDRTAPIVAAAGLALTAYLAIGARDLRIATGMAIFLAGIGVIAATRLDRLERRRAWLTGLVGLTATTVVATQLVAFGLVTLPARSSAFAAPVHEPIEYSGPLDDIARWANRWSPAGAVFLVPPYYDSFRVRANRAEVVDFKAFAFDDRAILEWYSRLQLVTGRQDLRLGFGFDAELRSAYDGQPLSALVAAGRRYGAAYVVVPNRALSTADRPIYRNAEYAVIAVTS
jgi:hypothetical protein